MGLVFACTGVLGLAWGLCLLELAQACWGLHGVVQAVCQAWLQVCTSLCELAGVTLMCASLILSWVLGSLRIIGSFAQLLECSAWTGTPTDCLWWGGTSFIFTSQLLCVGTLLPGCKCSSWDSSGLPILECVLGNANLDDSHDTQ